MKRISLILATLTLALMTGCGVNLHKPTTAGNAGTSALVAYSVAGFTAGQYLALSLCADPPVYPCKTQAINDQVTRADTAAYLAAKAADAAGDASQASDEIGALKDLNDSPAVSAQLKIKQEQTP